MLAAGVAELCPGDPDGAEQLADAIDRAAEQAAGATRALIQGRAALRTSG